MVRIVFIDDGTPLRPVSFSLQVEETTTDDKILFDNRHHGTCDSMNGEMDRSETIFAGEGVCDCCFFLPRAEDFPMPLPCPHAICLNYMIRARQKSMPLLFMVQRALLICHQSTQIA